MRVSGSLTPQNHPLDFPKTHFRYAFDFTFTRMASIDAGPGAKFEDFVSMLDVD